MKVCKSLVQEYFLKITLANRKTMPWLNLAQMSWASITTKLRPIILHTTFHTHQVKRVKLNNNSLRFAQSIKWQAKSLDLIWISQNGFSRALLNWNNGRPTGIGWDHLSRQRCSRSPFGARYTTPLLLTSNRRHTFTTCLTPTWTIASLLISLTRN